MLYMLRCRPLSMCTVSDLIRSATHRDIFGNELIVSVLFGRYRSRVAREYVKNDIQLIFFARADVKK